MNCGPSGFLLLPRLRVHNANAIAGPMSWGFPAITAFTGFVHALQRRLNAAGIEIQLKGVGVICHGFELQSSKPAGKHTHVFHLTRNPLNKDGSTASLIEEGRMHLDVSLLVGVESELPTPSDELNALAHQCLTQALSMRLAGGSLLPPTHMQACHQPVLWPIYGDERENIKQFKQIKRRLLPGFALVERRELLAAHTQQFQAQHPEADALAALLDCTRLNIDPPNPEADADAPDAQWQRRARKGWWVPMPVGYRALSALYDAGTVANARDKETPFCFVEAVYSLGEWISPHRVGSEVELLWHYHADPDAGLYLCTNLFNPSLK